jgi:hypothetical protein
MNSDPVARWEEILRSRYWDELLVLAGSDMSSLYDWPAINALTSQLNH